MVAGAGGERGDGRGWGAAVASQPVLGIAEDSQRQSQPPGGCAVAALSGINDRWHVSADRSWAAVTKLPRSLQVQLGTLGTGGEGGSPGENPADSFRLPRSWGLCNPLTNPSSLGMAAGDGKQVHPLHHPQKGMFHSKKRKSHF